MLCRLRHYVGVDSFEETSKYFLDMEITDPAFQELIGSSYDKSRHQRECFQLLHHTFVYGVEESILLVGTDKYFVFAVRVHFPLALLEAYNRLIDICYERWFGIFYLPEFNDFPLKKIKQALSFRNAAKPEKDRVDLHSFVTHFKLWRALNVEVPAGIKFPLPPIRMAIPFINAFWNSTKGPSDTMTMLLDSCEENLGIRSPQCVAVARFLGVAAIAFHRLNQNLSAKDPSAYQSMESYRHAANERFSFQKSIAIIIHFLQEQVKILAQEQEMPTLSLPPMPPSTPPRRTTTRSAAQTQAVVWHNTTTTGGTPGRGRRAKNNSVSSQSNEERAANCIGLVPVIFDQNKKLRCRLCNSLTHYYCTWCKRPLCLSLPKGGDVQGRIDSYCDKYNVTTGNRPPKNVSMEIFNSKTNTKTKMNVVNTCYHIAHGRQWKEFFAFMNSNKTQNGSMIQNYCNYHTINKENN